ncbi:trehalose-phosphatase (plasmid) [Halorarum halophilum]|uniref:Trehalose 6-phosphate phosphatase n=1 Tax=Halorarum halophilum TaxID=2743090 RepID=A0A7D5K3M6_9EURY|nr:trehalose-phosphatase [Halobaculum halophilum]
MEHGPPALRFRNPWPRLRDRISDAPGILLCLDFDGTLAPIVDDPEDATLHPGARPVLRRLVDDPTVEVAVVSGRSLADLRERADIDDVLYAGNHGLELGDDDGSTVDPKAASLRPAIERAVADLRERLADVPGTLVEDKGVTATVHYRRTPPERVDEVRTAVEVVGEPADDLRLTYGKSVIELRPDVPGGKDRAVRRLREDYPDFLPVFVGDDVTDEDAFRALPGRGIAVLVGDRDRTAASLRVGDPDGAIEFLRWLADVRVDASDGVDGS